MKDLARGALERFLSQIPSLTVDDFVTVNETARTALVTRNEARPLLALGAADASWVDKRVRDTVRPLLLSLEWPGAWLSSRVVSLVRVSADAIIQREWLSPEQYEAFVGGFRQVGVTMPLHPSQEADETNRATSTPSPRD